MCLTLCNIALLMQYIKVSTASCSTNFHRLLAEPRKMKIQASLQEKQEKIQLRKLASQGPDRKSVLSIDRKSVLSFDRKSFLSIENLF